MPRITLIAMGVPAVAFIADRLPTEAEQTEIAAAAEAALHEALEAHRDDLSAALITLDTALLSLAHVWQVRLMR